MITKSDLMATLGTLAAVAKEADCSKQAVAQWSERIPLRSAVCIARKGRCTSYAPTSLGRRLRLQASRQYVTDVCTPPPAPRLIGCGG